MANILIAGFNNWGKTYLISQLFGKKRFVKSAVAHFAGHDFCIIPASNDDLGKNRYMADYRNRIVSLQKKGHAVTHVIAAFCPTLEPNNDSRSIIEQLFSHDRVFLIPIEYKWCGHAKLRIK